MTRHDRPSTRRLTPDVIGGASPRALPLPSRRRPSPLADAAPYGSTNSERYSSGSEMRMQQAVADLHLRSAKLQRSLDAVAASHAAQVEELRAMAEGDYLREVSANSAARSVRLGGNLSFGFGDLSLSSSLPSSPCRTRSHLVQNELLAAAPGSEEAPTIGEQASAVYTSETSVDTLPREAFGRPTQRRHTDESQAVSVAAGPGQDDDTPEVIAKMHTFWDMAPDSPTSRNTVAPSRVQTTSGLAQSKSGVDDHFGAIRQDNNFIGRSCIVKPNSTAHLLVALMSLAVMLYDVLSLPLVVAFRLEATPAFYFLDLGACVFWTCDIIANFFTGYVENERIEMRMRKIAQRYLRTWCIFDVIVVGFDWATQLITEFAGLGFARALKTPRMVRIFFRTLRLLRVVKLVMVLEDVVQFVVSDWLSSTLSVAKLLLGMCIFNHFVACGWYAVGKAGIAAHHWVDGLEAENASKFHLYIASFHWSMTQYTPAPNGYHPQNEHERLFACLTLLIGISVFSMFLGKITSLLTHMGASAFTRSRDNTTMRRYLCDNKVSVEVASSVNMFLKRRQASRRVIPYSEVRHFLTLPYSLAVELRYQAHIRTFDNHPLLRFMHHTTTVLRDEYLMLIVKVCSRAVTELGLKWGDELLQAGCPANQMIFVKFGKLQYFNQVAFTDPRSQSENAVTLGVGLQHQWACEMALWCEWYCHGILQSNGVSVVLSVDAHVFHMLVADCPTIFCELKRYSEAYTRMLTDAQEGSWDSCVDDCWGQVVDVHEMTEDAFNTVILPQPQRSVKKDTAMSSDTPSNEFSPGYMFRKYLFGL